MIPKEDHRMHGTDTEEATLLRMGYLIVPQNVMDVNIMMHPNICLASHGSRHGSVVAGSMLIQLIHSVDNTLQYCKFILWLCGDGMTMTIAFMHANRYVGTAPFSNTCRHAYPKPATFHFESPRHTAAQTTETYPPSE